MNTGSQFHRGDGYQDDPLSGLTVAPTTNITGINPAVTSWATLAAIGTVTAFKPAVIIWTDSDMITHATMLRAGSDATNTAQGIQRPNDFDTVLNAYVWYDTQV